MGHFPKFRSLTDNTLSILLSLFRFAIDTRICYDLETVCTA